MELRQLRYFLAVCDQGSINKAARMLNVAQPAVSRQIAELESELGTTLFERSTAGVRPTVSGRQLVAMAEAALQGVERISETFGGGRQPARVVAIGLPPAIIRLMTGKSPDFLSGTRNHSMIRIVDGTSHRLEAWLRAGELTFAVVTNPPPDENLTRTPLWREPLYLVGRGETPWPSSADLRSVHEAELALSMKEDPVRAYLDREFARSGIAPRTSLEFESMPSLLAMIQGSDVRSILPLSAFLHEYQAGLLRASRLRGLAISRMVVSRPHVPLGADARRVIDWLQNDLFDSYVAQATSLDPEFELTAI